MVSTIHTHTHTHAWHIHIYSMRRNRMLLAFSTVIYILMRNAIRVHIPAHNFVASALSISISSISSAQAKALYHCFIITNIISMMTVTLALLLLLSLSLTLSHTHKQARSCLPKQLYTPNWQYIIIWYERARVHSHDSWHSENVINSNSSNESANFMCHF